MTARIIRSVLCQLPFFCVCASIVTKENSWAVAIGYVCGSCAFAVSDLMQWLADEPPKTAGEPRQAGQET